MFLDVDGTLLELAATPEGVRVDAEIAALLPALADALRGAIALITGRTIADVDRLFPGLALPVAGQHGFERRGADGRMHRHVPGDGLARMHEALAETAARHEGLLLEDKGATLALHYRRAPQLASHVHRAVRTAIARETGSGVAWRLQRGKFVVEVKPDGRDKGTAIEEFMAEAPFRDRRPVFAGDDLTDEYGFAAVERLGGWAIKVGSGATCARFRLAGVVALRRWLAAAVRALR